jgi:hypothetical protein
VIEKSYFDDIFVLKSMSHMRIADSVAKQDDIFPVLDLVVDREVLDYGFVLIETMDDRLSDSYRFPVFIPDKCV